MNRMEFRTKLKDKGVASKTVPYVLRALTASNCTFVGFGWGKSEMFDGPDGIIDIDVNKENSYVELTGSFDENSRPDTLIRITEPRKYLAGYDTQANQTEYLVAKLMDDGSIISTRAIPRSLNLFSPVVGYYSPNTVSEYAENEKYPESDPLHIVFHMDPDEKHYLKCQRMSYRTPFEPQKLMGLESEKTTVKIRRRVN